MNYSERFPPSGPVPEQDERATRAQRKQFRHKYSAPGRVAQALVDRIRRRPSVHSAHRPEFKRELQGLYEALDASIEAVVRDLEWQKEYGLVEHTRVHSADELVEKLAHGVHTIEFDVRGTADDVPVVAHSITGKGTVGYFGRGLHEMSLAEARENVGGVLSLDEAFTLFDAYKDTHELIVEIKDESMVDEVAELLKAHGLQRCVRVASLIPDVIKKMHDMCPEVGLILNSGILPYFNMPVLDAPSDVAPENLAPYMLGLDDVMKKGWCMVRIGRLTVVLSAGLDKPTEGLALGPDDEEEGRGEQRAYVFFRLPDELAAILRENPDRNAASVSLHCLVGSIAKIFAPETGQAIIDRVAQQAEDLQVPALGALGLTALKGVAPCLEPTEQLEALRELGVKVVYTDEDPVSLAHSLQAQQRKAA